MASPGGGATTLGGRTAILGGGTPDTGGGTPFRLNLTSSCLGQLCYIPLG